MKFCFVAMLGFLMAGVSLADSVPSRPVSASKSCDRSPDSVISLGCSEPASSRNFAARLTDSVLSRFSPASSFYSTNSRKRRVELATIAAPAVAASNSGPFVQESLIGETTPAAEPATGILVGLGLAAAGFMRRRTRKPLIDATWHSLG